MNSMQSSNFDFPPASPPSVSGTPPVLHPYRYPALSSASNPTPTPFPPMSSLPTQQARLRQLQDLLRLEREDREEEFFSDPPSILTHISTDQRRHQGIVRNIPVLHTPAGWPPRPGGTAQRPTPSIANTEHRLRRRTTPSERYLQRPLPAARQRSGADHLAQSRLALEAIRSRDNDMPLGVSLNEDITTLEYEGEAEVNRRNKRRKLDIDSCGAGLSGFSYGHYGQVEPGELNMQIVSCDGGNHAEGDGGSREYWAENVLRKDASVYRTKNNRCSLVLRHRGGTAFTLTGLDIKAPRRGYTAPVREGVVFVSMTCGDLLSRTARYQIRYSPSPSNILPSSSGRINNRQDRRSVAPPFRTPDAAQMETHRVMSELNRRPDLNYSMTPTPHSRDDRQIESTSGRVRVSLDNVDGSGDGRSLLDAGENCDFPSHITNDSDQNQADTETPGPPPFTVTTEYTDEGDDANQDSGSDWDELGLRAASPFSDEDEDETLAGRIPVRRPIGGRWEERLRLFGRSPLDFQPRMISSSAEATLQAEPVHPALGEGDEVPAPHARFSIKRDKSKCSIKFDPPISGRFLLLKLWSPSRDEDIDVQSVVAHGFAGPRYFPALEMR